MGSMQHWQSELYDGKLNYVSAFGQGVLELLNPQPGERILDVGCGTGDLAHQIAQSGAEVIGIDKSVSMLEAARRKYPQLTFRVEDAEDFKQDEDVDAVFSNAALHWMTRPEQVLTCVREALRPGGRFIAEFGGQGNVERVIRAVGHVLARDYGIDASTRNPWYFPSIGQYTALLERQGFRVMYALHFDRPTRMEDGENGLAVWLEGFASPFFAGFSSEEKTAAVAKIAEEARADLYKDGSWTLDYKRIRILAVKLQR